MKKFIIIPVTINLQSMIIHRVRFGRKLYVAIFLTLLLSNGANIYAQSKAYIPDTNFRNFLNTTYPTFMDGSGDSLLIDSAATLTGILDCGFQNIADLTGVEYFVNIIWLKCIANQLTALPGLTNNTALLALECSNNQLTALPALTNNTALLALECSNNQLTALPDLTNNTALGFLYCDTNQLTALPDLANNTALQELSCSANQLTVLPALTNNTALWYLDCSYNQLTALPALTNNTALLELHCVANQLTVLPDLTNITALQWLNCNNNQLTALPSLTNNTALQLLFCNFNQLTTLPDLTNNITLVTLDCSGNQLTALPDLANNTTLLTLFCNANQLIALPDLTNNTALKSLSCEINQLTSLPDLTNNTTLVSLVCRYNKLDFSDARELRIADAISTLTTYIYSPQNPFGIPDTFNLNAGNTLILSIANQDSALSYQWFRGTDTIAGATDTLLIIPNVTLADSGVYTCRSYGTELLHPSPMTNGPGISSFVSEGFLVNISTVGLNELFDTDNWLKLYPNPNTGNFTLEMEISRLAIGNIQINITNTLGQSVYAETLNNIKGKYKKQIDLPNPTGIYNLQIQYDKNVINKKIVLQKQ